MNSDILSFDIKAVYTSTNTPVYRVYVDGFLMTERDYHANALLGEYITERSAILLQGQTIKLVVEWVNKPLSYSIDNLQLDKRSVNNCEVVTVVDDLKEVLVDYED